MLVSRIHIRRGRDRFFRRRILEFLQVNTAVIGRKTNTYRSSVRSNRNSAAFTKSSDHQTRLNKPSAVDEANQPFLSAFISVRSMAHQFPFIPRGTGIWGNERDLFFVVQHIEAKGLRGGVVANNRVIDEGS